MSPELARQVNLKLLSRGLCPIYDESTGEKLDCPPRHDVLAAKAVRPSRVKSRPAGTRIEPNPTRAERPCRKCGVAFKPKGPTSRVCGPCKSKAGREQIASVFRNSEAA